MGIQPWPKEKTPTLTLTQLKKKLICHRRDLTVMKTHRRTRQMDRRHRNMVKLSSYRKHKKNPNQVPKRRLLNHRQ